MHMLDRRRHRDRPCRDRRFLVEHVLWPIEWNHARRLVRLAYLELGLEVWIRCLAFLLVHDDLDHRLVVEAVLLELFLRPVRELGRIRRVRASKRHIRRLRLAYHRLIRRCQFARSVVADWAAREWGEGLHQMNLSEVRIFRAAGTEAAPMVDHAPVPSRYFVASFGAFGANPCFDVVTLFVVMSDVDRSESLTAAYAGGVAPFRNRVASPGIAGSSFASRST